MRRRYDDELVELRSTYRAVVASSASAEVAKVVDSCRSVVFVGSGGALAVARFAADLHMRATGELAVGTTPLEATTTPLGPDVGLVLFSAGGRNPDAALAVSGARARGARSVGVVTCRSAADLPRDLTEGGVKVVTIPSTPDGFLATNSLLAMAAAICGAYGNYLPKDLPGFVPKESRAIRPSCLVLTAPGYAAIGLDLEARLTEIGLAAVQVADYRNLAHGRHVGLVRRQSETTVIATRSPEFAQLADRTIGLLPAAVDLVDLRTPLPWPGGALDLLVGSMMLTGDVARRISVDAGRPAVQPFGRRLYNLPLKRLIPRPSPDPVGRKLRAAGLCESARPAVSSAFQTWDRELRRRRFTGIVLDYDGTCCPTWDRFREPPANVQEVLTSLLRAGIIVGFASGRGRSLPETTRRWLPEDLWASVYLGLYNGTAMQRLSDEDPPAGECEGDLAEAADRLDGIAIDGALTIERRRTQVSVSASAGRLSGSKLLPLVLSLLARPPALACKAFASGHSVDVLPAEGGKAGVLKAVALRAGGDVLVIGDQGQAGGNDFELLAATQWSLSVDDCSADPTRCWNVDHRGLRGPELLVKYLQALDIKAGRARWTWRLA